MPKQDPSPDVAGGVGGIVKAVTSSVRKMPKKRSKGSPSRLTSRLNQGKQSAREKSIRMGRIEERAVRRVESKVWCFCLCGLDQPSDVTCTIFHE